MCNAEWTSSSFLYKGIQFQPAKLWIIIFVFDSSASRACLSKSGNVDKKVLNDIANGLKSETHIATIYITFGYVFDKVVLQLMPRWFLGW